MARPKLQAALRVDLPAFDKALARLEAQMARPPKAQPKGPPPTPAEQRLIVAKLNDLKRRFKERNDQKAKLEAYRKKHTLRTT